MKITADTKINDIAAELPESIPVFEHYQVKYCCGQKGTLAEACKEAKAPLSLVLEAIQSSLQNASEAKRDWTNAPLPALVRHILDHHHTYERLQIKTIQHLFNRVVAIHEKKHKELPTLQNRFEKLAAEYKKHMGKEEASFFPSFQHEVAPGVGESARRETARQFLPLIEALERDHDDLLVEWSKMRALADDFEAPEDACTGYRALYKALTNLEEYQQQHIAKENDVLFKRVKAMAN